MLFPITTICLVACLIWTRQKGGRRGPLRLALTVWFGEVVLISLPIFSYQVEYSIVGDVVVAACLTVTTAGYFIVRNAPLTAPETHGNRGMELRAAKVLGVCGAVGSILLLLDARARGTEIQFDYLTQNLRSIRSMAFQSLLDSSPSSGLAIFGGYLAACSFLTLISAARFGRSGGRTLITIAALDFVLLAVVSLFLYGGRATLFYAGFVIIISLYLSGKRLLVPTPKTLFVGALAVASLLYFSTSWLEQREGPIDASRVLMGNQRAELRPWIASVARGDKALELGLVSVGYFSSPLPTLSYYINQGPIPGPFWGAYSFPLPTLVWQKLIGVRSPPSWIEIRRQVFRPFEAVGHSGNVWATWLRDLMVDFGYLGAVIFCGVFGSFLGWTRNRFESTGALHYHAFEVIACFALTFGAFANVLFFSYLANAFFISVVMMLLVRLRSFVRATVQIQVPVAENQSH